MLPEGFRFSQTSLQDYVDCARRFQLRYLESRVWPGVQVEPVLDYERSMVRGARFHRLVERHQLGVDAELLAESVVGDVDLMRWWQAYLDFSMLHELDGKRYPELALAARVLGFPVLALFDLVVVSGEHVLIFDWKTYERVPSRMLFQSRLQTRVYLYVMARQGVFLFGDLCVPDVISLVYWVLGEVVVFDYSSAFFESDSVYLSGLVSDVLSHSSGELWPLVLDEGVCMYCVYRSLCARGDVVGRESKNIVNIVDGVDLFGLSEFFEVGF